MTKTFSEFISETWKPHDKNDPHEKPAFHDQLVKSGMEHFSHDRKSAGYMVGKSKLTHEDVHKLALKHGYRHNKTWEKDFAGFKVGSYSADAAPYHEHHLEINSKDGKLHHVLYHLKHYID